MTEAERRERCERFRRQYYDSLLDSAKAIAERLILVDNLARLPGLVEPDRVPRPPVRNLPDEAQAALGPFHDPALHRSAITDDMDIIRFYREELGEETPSFVAAGPRRALVFDPEKVRIAVLTSGGLAPGLNTVVEAIVTKHVGAYGLRPGARDGGAILGFYDGLVGIEEDRYEELTAEKVCDWGRLGGSKLGVGRGACDVNRWLDVLQRHRIDIVYIIGGDGSLTGAWLLAEEAKGRGLALAVSVVPKTMDNDILWASPSFGFASATDKATEIINTLHAEAESTRRVCLIQLFGADTGHLVPLVFAARGGLTGSGCKRFPTGGILWHATPRSTGQPPLLSREARQAIAASAVEEE